ncbi:MAG: hypothetical protein U9N02_02085 [Campylobacterota bacterium]|nr:hypothetical protein [Campylobacterota bacterium]
MKWLFFLLITLLFTGCDLFQSQDEKAKLIANEKIAFEKKVQESKEVQLKKLSAQTQKELAVLESKKELALIEKARELEKIRMQSELEKQKIIFEQEKAKAVFEQKMQQDEQSNNMELKRYMMIILALLLIVSSFFIYYYFKKRREDKLRAYNDNLQKYFNQKENDARVKIAEKMLDAISSGNLDKSQENQLIGAFSGQASRRDEIIEIDTKTQS